MFFVFIALTFIISLVLLLWRWRSLVSEGKMESLFSRESAFLFNNLLFVLLFLICMAGILFPLISELFTGTKMTVGPSWYKQTTGPVFAGLLLLMGVVPLTAWGSSTAKALGRKLWKPVLASLFILGVLVFTTALKWLGILALWLISLAILVTLYDYGNAVLLRSRSQKENLFSALVKVTIRNRHRYGGYIVHLGVVMIALGVVGTEFYQAQTQTTVATGGTINLDGFEVKYRNLTQYTTSDGTDVAQAVLEISRNGRILATVSPSRDYYPGYQQSVTIPGIYSTLAEDVYVVLIDWQPIAADGATFHVYHNPLINWIWIGTVVLVLGSLLAISPSRSKANSVKLAEA